MKIGIVGCGVIGGVMKMWLENNTDHDLLISDPNKGFFDSMNQADIVFVSIHIPTERDGSQNLFFLEEILKNLPHVPIFIRTTLLPGTCDALSKKMDRKIYFMPEFLTERTAYEDFCKQPMVFTGEADLLQEIFVNKSFIEMSNFEAELAKYAHNVFGALKVTYFNAVYELCQNYGIKYENVLDAVLLSGYINDCHTRVPGPDGKLGYGGKCFPKDVNAFLRWTDKFSMSKLLGVVPEVNDLFRGDNDEN